MKARGNRRRKWRTIHAIFAACLLALFLGGEMGSVWAQAPAPTPVPPPDFVRNQLMVRLRDGGSGAALTALFSKLGAIGVKTFETLDGLYVITLPEGLDVLTASQLAKALDSVAYAEPNYIVTIDRTEPDDPSFDTLWGLDNTGQSGGTLDADIDAPEAWDLTTGDSEVVVAVLDTGIDYTHPDLVANMFRNEPDCDTNGADDDGNGYVDDCYGIDTFNGDTNPLDDNSHGTHVAGTIGASGHNGVGVVGVNWTVRLLPCKFLDALGSSGDVSGAITCLEYVANMKDRGVNIVATNNSWGGGGFSQALLDAIEAQRQRGILFIAAAGNVANDNDTTANYPSNYDVPNVIAVASTTRTDTRSSFSNFGRLTVHLGAPGSEIFSTTPGNTYGNKNGTSMATPHVAGVAALLAAQDPTRDWRAIRNLILAGGDSIGAMNGNTVTGKRLNAFGSLACSGATVFSRLKPIADMVTTTVGTGVTVSALNIACAAGNGNVAVSISSGGTLTLMDDGVAPDQEAGDGIYSRSFVPTTPAATVLTFPGGATITVRALSATSYSAQTTAFAYRSIVGTSLGLGDDTSAAIATPFPINVGGVSFNTLFVSSNGTANVSAANSAWANMTLPTATASTLIAPFWDDLVPVLGTAANVFWEATGSPPHRELVVEWRNVVPYLSGSACPASGGATFQVVFFEGLANILFNYADATFGGTCAFADSGRSATVGVQTSSTVAGQSSFNSPAIADGSSILWMLPGQPGTFSDTPLTGGATPVKALHITELRARIDMERARVALAPMTWTDPSLVAGVTMAKAQHLLEMRSALVEAYQAAGLAAPSFAEGIQAGQTMITAAQITELRSAVIALETR